MKRKLFGILTAVICMVTTLAGTSAMAASWPSLSSSAYCEFTAQKKINVYKDSSCSTRGTSSPKKSYNAYVAKGDVCKIYEITSKYIKLSYPTSSGSRTGYIKRGSLFDVSSPSESVTSKGKATTYTKPDGSSYGYTENGDQIFKCGSDGGYTIIIYTAKSGKRGYKLAYVKTLDYNRIIKGTSSSKSSNNRSLADIAKGEIDYQGTKSNGKGTGDYTKYGKWIGADGQQWCASFVSWCADRAGIPSSVIPITADCDAMKNGSTRYHKWDSNSLNFMKKNDVIFFAPTSNPSDATHTGIITKISGTSVSVVEGNTGPYYGPDIVREITYTVDRNSGRIVNGYNGYCFCGYISVD